MKQSKRKSLTVVGLGYVGLPLATALSYHYSVKGFDIEKTKVAELNKIKTLKKNTYKSLNKKEFLGIKKISFTSEPYDIENQDYYIVTVPTPIDQAFKPDLSHLIEASSLIGKSLKKGSLVIYESTVYPGATEDICIPTLEKVSGMKHIEDFGVCYSPERVNPGDNKHKLENVNKIIAADNYKNLKILKKIYKNIIQADLVEVSSIKVAETCKVLENTQRDINIALVNELSIICDKLGIKTNEVLSASSTKWNFINFKPGLVGGHCISVDPHYLSYKSKLEGYFPEVIHAGRKVNDGMWSFIRDKTISLSTSLKKIPHESRLCILGITFKENCDDIRNSQVIKIYQSLRDFGFNISIFDPVANIKEVQNSFNVKLLQWNELKKYDGLILAVAHDYFKKLKSKDFEKILKDKAFIIDIKSILSATNFKKHIVWQL